MMDNISQEEGEAGGAEQGRAGRRGERGGRERGDEHGRFDAKDPALVLATC
jgi:hypothetical protein